MPDVSLVANIFDYILRNILPYKNSKKNMNEHLVGYYNYMYTFKMSSKLQTYLLKITDVNTSTFHSWGWGGVFEHEEL